MYGFMYKEDWSFKPSLTRQEQDQEQEQEQEQVSGRVEEVFLTKYSVSPLAGVGRHCMRHHFAEGLFESALWKPDQHII